LAKGHSWRDLGIKDRAEYGEKNEREEQGEDNRFSLAEELFDF
jgi:hypothetical protein